LLGFAWQSPDYYSSMKSGDIMTTEVLENIIQENEQKVKSLPDGSFKKEHILEGMRYLEKACEKLNNLNSDRNEIYRLIDLGLMRIYYDQQ
jgi:hypothetical protein